MATESAEQQTSTENAGPLTTVELPPEDDGLDEPAAAPAAGETPEAAQGRLGHRQRRREWFKDQQQKTANLEQQLRARDAETQRQALELAELRGRVSAAAPQADPHEARLKELREKAQRHLSASATARDQATAQRELDAYHQSLEDISDARAERQVARARAEWEQSRPDPAQAAAAAELGAEFRWLRDNVPARRVADAFLEQMIAGGHPDTYETYRAACARAGQALGLGGAPGRAPAARYTLPPGGNGESPGGGGGSPTLTEDQRIMAERLYPDLDEKGAHTKWWQNVGSKIKKG